MAEPSEHRCLYSFHLPASSIELWLPSLRELLAQHGLHLVTDAERQRMVTDQLAAVRTRKENAVLDAMAGLRLERVGAHWSIGVSDARFGVTLAQVVDAELARRREKSDG